MFYECVSSCGRTLATCRLNWHARSHYGCIDAAMRIDRQRHQLLGRWFLRQSPRWISRGLVYFRPPALDTTTTTRHTNMLDPGFQIGSLERVVTKEGLEVRCQMEYSHQEAQCHERHLLLLSLLNLSAAPPYTSTIATLTQ